MAKKDYYKILGVQKNATGDEIKRAFRRLAHQYHPDKPTGNADKFKEVNEAYQVLSDEKKRALYDRFGAAEPIGGFSGGAPRGDFGEGWDFAYDFSNLGDLGEVLDDFFEGIGVRPRRRAYQRGSDLETALEIDLEEAFRGTTKEITISTYVSCDRCGGRGAEADADFTNCSICGGQGEIREHRQSFFGSFSQVKACAECRGTGRVPRRPCRACKGSGRTMREVRVNAMLHPGVQDGQIITFKNKGEAGERGTTPGDLYVRVKIRSHRIFTREKDDVVVKKEVNFFHLLLGKPIEVPTISGGAVKVEIPAHFNLKDDLRIPGEGMPHFGSHGRGDLLVRFILKVPKKLGAKEKKILEDLEKKF